MVAQFQVGDQMPVHEERGTNPRPQREHQLDALAFNHAQALHVGVVGHASRLARPRNKRIRQVETDPIFMKIDSGLHLAVNDHSRKPRRDPAEIAEFPGHLQDLRQHRLGRRLFGSLPPESFRESVALLIQQQTLYSRAADIDC